MCACINKFIQYQFAAQTDFLADTECELSKDFFVMVFFFFRFSFFFTPSLVGKLSSMILFARFGLADSPPGRMWNLQIYVNFYFDRIISLMLTIFSTISLFALSAQTTTHGLHSMLWQGYSYVCSYKKK